MEKERVPINNRLKDLIKTKSTIVYQDELTFISELRFRHLVCDFEKPEDPGTWVVYLPKHPRRGAISAIKQLINTKTIKFN